MGRRHYPTSGLEKGPKNDDLALPSYLRGGFNAPASAPEGSNLPSEPSIEAMEGQKAPAMAALEGSITPSEPPEGEKEPAIEAIAAFSVAITAMPERSRVTNEAPESSEAMAVVAAEVVSGASKPPPAWIDGARKVMQHFLLRHQGTTLVGYRSDLAIFAEHVGLVSVTADRPPDEATIAATLGAAALLACGRGDANAKVGDWKASMQRRGLAARTINRRLAAVNSMLTLGRQIGVIDWALDVPGIKVNRISNRKGPDVDKIVRLLMRLEVDGDDEAVRDIAVIRLLRLGLRRGEISSRDLNHVHLVRKKLTIRGKQRHEDEDVTLPNDAATSIENWLAVRGKDAGPLFVRMHTGERMTGHDIWKMTRGRGRQCFGEEEEKAEPIRPHGLRHNAATEALNLTGGNVSAVASFTRHVDIRIVQDYDDKRQDRGGEVAKLLDDDLSKRLDVYRKRITSDE